MQLHVGNLSVLITAADLRELAKEYGTVVSASVVVDGIDGLSKGFGFIELSTAEEGRVAIAGLNGREVKGQALTVDAAQHGPYLY